MVGDMRRIAYFGEKENREKLEEELYSGVLKTDEELAKRANELNVTLKITEDAKKIKTLEKALVGEVSTRSTMEVKRKRIYTTTNAYSVVELTGSEIDSKDGGNRSIIVFGNKITKALANDYLNQMWKSNVSLRFIGDIFLKVFDKVSQKTASIGKNYDVVITHAKFDEKEAEEYLNDLITRDVNLLGKFREKLAEDLIKQNETIQLANKIINQGEIGKVASVNNKFLEVTLNPNVQAYDSNWKILVKPGENVLMSLDSDKIVNIGDTVVIENENLCLKTNKANLSCDIILCNTDE
jgi:hypothetical protein